MKVSVSRVDWPYVVPFRISYSVEIASKTIEVVVEDDEVRGRGEGLALFYRGETLEAMQAQIEAVAGELEKGFSRMDLLSLLPAGGARNALDCALWDLEAKRSGRRAWQLAGLDSLSPVESDMTIGLDTPDVMADAARAAPRIRRLKLKLGGAGDADRVAAVRSARPDARLTVDPNQAWSPAQLDEFVPRLAELGVELIEQPLPVGEDDALLDFASAVPLCADESCQTVESLPSLAGKYSYVNIKLDKTGGLTAGLQLAAAAKAEGYGLMVGCMGGSSLSMAPAMIVAQQCDFIDLDTPLLTAADQQDPIIYRGSVMSPPAPGLWG